MWIKIWSTCLLISLINAEYLYDANPYSHFGGYASGYDNYKPTNYKFEYGVSDPTTGDHKSQWEVKENGVVRGAYSLLEPDGTTRLVEYYADDTGFHADVKKLGTAVHASEYGQLHSLSETHIANSLAYNGYGHGGITHSYGVPIPAAIKVVAPLEVHHAPIAKVQQVASVPQVIAPQIHHLGSPHDYGYAHDLPQYYNALENHYDAPVPVLQHPAPFKINAESHYAPASITKKYTQHTEPQIVTYSKPQIVKEIVQPQLVKYAEPEIITDIVQPQVVKYVEPQLVKYAVPAPEYYTKYSPKPAYVSAPEYYSAPVATPIHVAPAPVAKVAVPGKVQAVNPFARLFAPLTKYLSASAPVNKAVVIPPKTVYAEAPTKYVDYEAYREYKPEIVISSPHNYRPNSGYPYSHDY